MHLIQHTLTLWQDKYISDILNKYHIKNSNPMAIPLEAGIRYSWHDSNNLTFTEEHMLQIPYKQILGSFQYLVTLALS